MTTAPTSASPAPELSLPARDPALDLARLIVFVVSSICLAVAHEFCRNPRLIAEAGVFWRFLDRAIRLLIVVMNAQAAGELSSTQAARQPPVDLGNPANPANSSPSAPRPTPAASCAPSSTSSATSPASPPTHQAQRAPCLIWRHPFRPPFDLKTACHLVPTHVIFVTIS